MLNVQVPAGYTFIMVLDVGFNGKSPPLGGFLYNCNTCNCVVSSHWTKQHTVWCNAVQATEASLTSLIAWAEALPGHGYNPPA